MTRQRTHVPPPNRGRRHLPPGVHILHEDDQILVVDKPNGLLTIATEQRKTGTLYAKLTEYVRKGNAKSRNRIFIVHRLDRDASGVIVFAKTVEAKTTLQTGWDEFRKLYLAVVHGRLKEKSGAIKSHLVENDALYVRSSPKNGEGKFSHTAYRVLAESGNRSLLEIDLITGRKHQIRVHLSELGHPILGDRKYGAKADSHKQLALHAHSIEFAHPSTSRPMQMTAGIPSYFGRLIKMPMDGRQP